MAGTHTRTALQGPVRSGAGRSTPGTACGADKSPPRAPTLPPCPPPSPQPSSLGKEPACAQTDFHPCCLGRDVQGLCRCQRRRWSGLCGERVPRSHPNTGPGWHPQAPAPRRKPQRSYAHPHFTGGGKSCRTRARLAQVWASRSRQGSNSPRPSPLQLKHPEK